MLVTETKGELRSPHSQFLPREGRAGPFGVWQSPSWGSCFFLQLAPGHRNLYVDSVLTFGWQNFEGIFTNNVLACSKCTPFAISKWFLLDPIAVTIKNCLKISSLTTSVNIVERRLSSSERGIQRWGEAGRLAEGTAHDPGKGKGKELPNQPSLIHLSPHSHHKSLTQRIVIRMKTAMDCWEWNNEKQLANGFLRHSKENNYVNYFKFRNVESLGVTHLTIGNDRRRGNACLPTASSLIFSLWITDRRAGEKNSSLERPIYVYKAVNKCLLRTDPSNMP